MPTDVERFAEINSRLSELSEKKIRLEEQFKNKKEALSELLKEVKAAGYDPTKLKEIIQEKETTLKEQISAFEKEVDAVSAQISKIEV
jgi:uncharacterized protein (UPF0335 family)